MTTPPIDESGDSDSNSDSSGGSHGGATYYQSRKPKWWTQLSNRRGTKAQRQVIQRMTNRGYCMPKEILTDFSRVNNYIRCNPKQQIDNSVGLGSNSDGIDEWKRAWWDRALGIVSAVSSDGDGSSIDSIANNQQQQQQHPDINISDLLSNNTNNNNSNKNNNEKYAQRLQRMYNYKSPLLDQSQSSHQQYKQIWLEIGFGNGSNLLANARQHPHILFIACEIHQPGVSTVLRQMEQQLEVYEAASTRYTLIESPCTNIRILSGCDGIKLLLHLPNNYITNVLITFPDPWPNEHDCRCRVVQVEVLREMHRMLVNNSAGDGADERMGNDGGDGEAGSGRVYIATDATCFNDWTRKIFNQEEEAAAAATSNNNDEKEKDQSNTGATHSNWKEVIPTPDRESWLPIISYYEQKGLDEGRHTMLQCWEKI